MKELPEIKECFRVPDGYFEGLHKQIMDSLPEHHVSEAKVVKISRSRWMIAVAAVAVVLVAMTFTLILNNVEQVQTSATDNIQVNVEKLESAESVLEAAVDNNDTNSENADDAESKMVASNVKVSATVASVNNAIEMADESFDSYDIDEAASYMMIDRSAVYEMLAEANS